MMQHPEMLLYLALALLIVLAILAEFKASHKQEYGRHAASARTDGHKLVNNGGALKIEERIVFANHGINIDNSSIFMRDGNGQKPLTYKKDRNSNRLQEQLGVKGR